MKYQLKTRRVKSSYTQQGALLIESMVALAIFSVALLSLSGLQISASKSSMSSMLKTESAVSVSELVDNMRSNLFGVSSGHYDIDLNDNPVAIGSAVNQGERDVAEWLDKLNASAMLGTTSDVAINCLALACTIQLQWDDSRSEQELNSDDSIDADFNYIFEINF